MVPAGAIAFADSARGYRLRHGRGAHDVRPDRREVLDLPGRKDSATSRPAAERKRQAITETGKRETGKKYVDAEKSKVPQAAARPPHGQGVARRLAGVWRLRTKGARAGLDHGPADRGGARGDHAVHQAWRKALDTRVPG